MEKEKILQIVKSLNKTNVFKNGNTSYYPGSIDVYDYKGYTLVCYTVDSGDVFGVVFKDFHPKISSQLAMFPCNLYGWFIYIVEEAISNNESLSLVESLSDYSHYLDETIYLNEKELYIYNAVKDCETPIDMQQVFGKIGSTEANTVSNKLFCGRLLFGNSEKKSFIEYSPRIKTDYYDCVNNLYEIISKSLK